MNESELSKADDDFTREEAQVVADYLDRRLMHLEEDGLTDSYCYPRIYSFRRKLIRKYLKERE